MFFYAMIFICDYGNFVQKTTTTTNELDIAMTTAARLLHTHTQKKCSWHILY